MLDPYLYPNTNILRNRYNIHDEETLEKLEADFTSVRLAEIISDESFRLDINLDGLCDIHHYIFQDIYDWAGKIRTIPIEKYEPVLGGLSIEYSPVEEITIDAEAALAGLRLLSHRRTLDKLFLQDLTISIAELWKVHLFREGNTRTIVTFLEKYIASLGFPFDVQILEDNAEYLRSALVAANAIFSDLGDRRKPEYLQRILADALNLQSH